MNSPRRDRALQNPSYDAWKLRAPDYWDNDYLAFRCDECGEWAEECECEDGPTEPKPYTRADYEGEEGGS